MKTPITVKVSDDLYVTRFYDGKDAIFTFPELKRDRKVLADAQRDLAIEVDRRVADEPYQVRG